MGYSWSQFSKGRLVFCLARGRDLKVGLLAPRSFRGTLKQPVSREEVGEECEGGEGGGGVWLGGVGRLKDRFSSSDLHLRLSSLLASPDSSASTISFQSMCSN